MSPDGSATFSEISRHYDWEQWVSDANGVRMDVTYPSRPLRLITSLSTALWGDTAPVITRTDGSQGTQIDSRLRDTTWTWVLPDIADAGGAIGDNVLSGTAGCASHQNGELLGYCLMNGTALAYQGQTLVESPESIYLEADFVDGKLYLNAQVDTRVTFYWLQPVIAITDSGTVPTFSVEQELVTVMVTAGHHILDIK